MSDFSNLLDHAYSHASVVIVAEDHSDPVGKLLAGAVPQLASKNAVQLREMPIWFNPILDAHRTQLKAENGSHVIDDAKLKEMLGRLYQGNQEDIENTFKSIQPFHQHVPPVELYGIDPRFDKEYVQAHDKQWQRYMQKSLEESHAPARELAAKLSQNFPRHGEIEKQAQKLISEGLVPDAAAAWSGLQYAKSQDGYRNMTIIYGGSHTNGYRIPDIKADGVLDDAFKEAGLSVFKILSSSSADPKKASKDNYVSGLNLTLCNTAGRYDAFYTADNDRAFDAEGKPIFSSAQSGAQPLDFTQSAHMNRECPAGTFPDASIKYGKAIKIPVGP